MLHIAMTFSPLEFACQNGKDGGGGLGDGLRQRHSFGLFVRWLVLPSHK